MIRAKRIEGRGSNPIVTTDTENLLEERGDDGSFPGSKTLAKEVVGYVEPSQRVRTAMHVCRIASYFLVPWATYWTLRLSLTTLIPLWVDPGTTEYSIMAAMAVWLGGNGLFNYVAAASIKPGFSEAEDPDCLHLLRKGEPGAPPLRSHYCLIARRQVLKLYHYDPIVGNTIGFYNFRNYLLFFGFFAVYLGYLGFLCLASIWTCDISLAPEVQMEPYTTLCLDKHVVNFFFFFGGLCWMLFVFVASFLGVLSARNETTLEFVQRSIKMQASEVKTELGTSGTPEPAASPFCLGTRRKNFESIFGTDKVFSPWMLPGCWAPPGNGMHFQYRVGYPTPQSMSSSEDCEDCL